ncbi:hypothetical protein AXG93_2471s1020 [Marchantia polymorpha subsp. ruderalis]|uniref:Uncharacterized protein n=1 Tax=Marchantia polymorpha subsp. ruderalis TaxID=1480154 RepID=A0A176W0Z2_MARPO|nr:hypothetical protein AXG93_2471s1020 [Marchantia polymorpha subsp. ruderalis]
MGTCFSVLIRMELAQPGNQILGGNHQLYNGAPGYTSSDKKSYPLFFVPSRLANKLGHRLNLQRRHSNMAYSGAASFNRGTAGLPRLGRPERAEGRARITDLTRNARITVDLLSQAAHYGKSTISKPLRRSELCTIHCVCTVPGKMWGTLHRYQLSNQLIAQGPNPSGSKIFLGFTKKGSKCLPDTKNKDYVGAGKITRPNRDGFRRARNSCGFLQSSLAVKEPSSRSYCSIPEVSDNETSSRSNGSARPAPKAAWSDRVRMSVSEQIQAYLGPDNRYNGLIHIISDPTFLALCYESIRGKPGTSGSDAKPLDGPEWFVQGITHRNSVSSREGSGSSFERTGPQLTVLVNKMAQVVDSSILIELSVSDSLVTRDGTRNYKGEPANKQRTGGCRVLPFIFSAEFAERTVFVGVTLNIITYLFTVKHIHLADAANMATNFLGASYVFTLVGGFLADTFIGRYWTIIIFILVQTLVGIQLL